MANVTTGAINASLSLTTTKTPADAQASQTVDTTTISLAQTIANGTGANQAQQVWRDTPNIAGSADLDLVLSSGGGLVDAFGAAMGFAAVKGLVIRNRSSSDSIVLDTRSSIGNPMTTIVDGRITIPPGGYFQWYAPTAGGATVTASSADKIRIHNNGAGANDVDVIIFGH